MSGLDRSFAYSVPEGLTEAITPGCVVRVVLNGGGCGAGCSSTPACPPRGRAAPLSGVLSLGPSPEVIELAAGQPGSTPGACGRCCWRRRPPPRAFPCRRHRLAGRGTAAAACRRRAPSTGDRRRDRAGALVRSAVLRLPPAAPRLAVIEAAIDTATGSRGPARPRRFEKRRPHLGEPPRAARPPCGPPARGLGGGGRGGAGRRRHALGRAGAGRRPERRRRARRPRDSYQESAPHLGSRRARRRARPACRGPLSFGQRLPGRGDVSQARAWSPCRARRNAPAGPRSRCWTQGTRTRGRAAIPTRLASVIREAVSREPDRPVVAVLNRKGRARLLACARCRSLLRCEACGAALVQLERAAPGGLAVLHCPRCASSRRATLCRLRARRGPASCDPASPGPGRSSAALTGLEVAEVGRRRRAEAELPAAPVLIGTEAVLHRTAAASVVAFLDFDHELLAPRYRAGEQALALLALASRLVGGRRRSGRVVVRTRSPDHEVLDAAVHADPGRLSVVEGPRRRQLRLPPVTGARPFERGRGGRAGGEAGGRADTGRGRQRDLPGTLPCAGGGSRAARGGVRSRRDRPLRGPVWRSPRGQV